MHEVWWTEDAIQDLQEIDPVIRVRILKKVTWFALHLDSLVPEQLSGEFAGTYKLRIGDWRVIYRLDGETILIEAVGHRRDVYL